MVKNEYVPDCGDLIWLYFSPQAGHEQAGRRPAFVISPQNYNQKSSLCLVCPITSKENGYPFEVVLTSQKISGAILCDHVRSVDWSARKADFIDRVSVEMIEKVSEKVQLLLP